MAGGGARRRPAAGGGLRPRALAQVRRPAPLVRHLLAGRLRRRARAVGTGRRPHGHAPAGHAGLRPPLRPGGVRDAVSGLPHGGAGPGGGAVAPRAAGGGAPAAPGSGRGLPSALRAGGAPARSAAGVGVGVQPLAAGGRPHRGDVRGAGRAGGAGPPRASEAHPAARCLLGPGLRGSRPGPPAPARLLAPGVAGVRGRDPRAEARCGDGLGECPCFRRSRSRRAPGRPRPPAGRGRPEPASGRQGSPPGPGRCRSARARPCARQAVRRRRRPAPDPW